MRNQLGESGTEETLPSAAVFFGGTGAGGPALELDTDVGRERSVTYRAFIGNRVASGWVRAWRSHLKRHALGVGIPSAADVFRGIASAIDAARLRHGKTVRSILEPRSLRLGFGIINTDAIIRETRLENHGLLVDEFVPDAEGGHFQSRFVYAHATLIHAARRSVQRFSSHTRPPYFFAAVADSLNVLHRLAIMPVHVEGQHIVFVESGRERARAAQKFSNGHCFHKPTTKAELTALSQVHPDLRWLGCVREWPFRPDFVDLAPGACRIEEQRGFKPGTMPAYDVNFALKARIFSSHPFTEHAVFGEIDGTVLEEPTTSVDWRIAGIPWRGIPPAIPMIE